MAADACRHTDPAPLQQQRESSISTVKEDRLCSDGCADITGEQDHTSMSCDSESASPIQEALDHWLRVDEGRKALSLQGGATGLSNLGNTCYMNSAVQAVLHCGPMAQYLIQDLGVVEATNSRLAVLLEAQGLTRKVWGGEMRSCAPRSMLRAMAGLYPMFRGFEQHDAHEFLRCFLDTLHEALCHTVSLESKRVPCSLVKDLFQGELQSHVQCQVCKHVSSVTEPFYDLSVDIPGRHQMAKVAEERDIATRAAPQGIMASMLSSASELMWGSTDPISLEECLHSFCTSESLHSIDQYHCTRCKDRVNATKWLTLVHVPEIVCFHIKRFKHNSYWGSKINRTVTFPLHGLDMTQYMETEEPCDEDRLIYDLTAVVRHLGSASGGHYICYAKHPLTGLWHKYNDAVVTAVTEETVLRQQAYILVYSRRSIPPQRRRRNKDTVYNLFESSVAEDTNVWLSLQWLSKLDLLMEPGPVDNSSLCCTHGMPLPAAERSVWSKDTMQAACRIPATLWDALVAKYGLLGPRIDVDATMEPCERCEADLRLAEKEAVLALDRMCAAKGDQQKLYIISETWLTQWRSYVAGKGDQPGPIDNTVLLDGDDFKPNLAPKTHYRGVGEPVWSKLHSIYGGGPTLIRPSLHLYD